MGSQQIIVLGMHRSGTSLLAHLVHMGGIAIGQTSDLMTPDSNNPNGYWEHKPLVQFNNHLLKAVQSSWVVPPRSPSEVSDLLKRSALAGQAQQLIKSMSLISSPWVWKDPRTSILLPFWRALLPNTAYIISVRHPVAVAQSLNKWHGFPLTAGILLWQLYIQSILSELPEQAPLLFVSYENILQQPLPECDRLGKFLNHTCGLGGATQSRLDAMLEVIQKDGRHFEGIDLDDNSLLDDGQRKLYQLCSQLATEGSKNGMPDAHLCQVYPGWRDYLSFCDAMELKKLHEMRGAKDSRKHGVLKFLFRRSDSNKRFLALRSQQSECETKSDP